MVVYHLNCGILHAPPGPAGSCHCLLIEQNGLLTLIDTGIGLHDIGRPQERIGQAAIDAAGFQFHESLTAARQIERLGYNAAAVTDIIITHADPDHVGGIADFPLARVHIAHEEHTHLQRGHGRYSPSQFDHQPQWVLHPPSEQRWHGLETRPVSVANGAAVSLVPLFGHTLGHSGVAIHVGERWLLHVGDAYYLRGELASDDHPVTALAIMRADDDNLRRKSLAELRRLNHDHAASIDLIGYHDFSEFPTNFVSGVPEVHR